VAAAVAIGLAVHADVEFQAYAERLLNEVDYLEVTPEALWRWDDAEHIDANEHWQRVLALGRAAGCFFVGHGVGLSLGSLADDDRQRRWRERIRIDREAFRFAWYTEHLGATMLGGVHATLPCPLPMTAPHARVVRRQLEALRDVVGTVGVENSANHFCLGAPRDEPAFLTAVTDGPELHLLLDLHNLHAMARNLRFDPLTYLAALPLDRVIEIHVAGGGGSNAAWLPSRRSLVLDGHDRRVPEPVWDLLDAALPHCARLRGITLERMHGTVTAADVPLLRDELRRARRAVTAPREPRSPRPPPPRGELADARWTVADERAYGLALCGPDPVAALHTAAIAWPPPLRALADGVDEDGVRMTALLIAKLRFERIVNGSADAARCFRTSPVSFARAFWSYHDSVEPAAHAPWHEARRFRAWCRRAAATTAPDAEPHSAPT
jgi:uncharacterized protein (UPF0276 family)